MSNILIWIDSSIRIKEKILMLNESLLTNFDKVLFISQDEKSAKNFRKEGINIISIEKNIFMQHNIKSIDYSSIFPTNINQSILVEIIKLSSYKSKNLNDKFYSKYSDPYSQIYLYKSFFCDLIDSHAITHSLILNGFSISSYSFLTASYKRNLNILFWENGLYPNSLFINKVGVNAFAESEAMSFIKEDKRIFLSLEELINYEFTEYKLIQNALITLQVNFDSNIKLFSPFFSTIDFLDFIIKNLEDNYFDLFKFRVRNHPKIKISIDDYLKKFINLERSNSKNFTEDLNWSKLVLTINSTTGLEAILNKKNLIAFGNSYYSKFLRYKLLNIDGIEIKVFVFNSNLESDLKRREKLFINLNQSSLFLNENKKNWKEKIINTQNKSLNPYFINKDFNKLLYEKKVTNTHIPKNKSHNLFYRYLQKLFNKIQVMIS